MRRESPARLSLTLIQAAQELETPRLENPSFRATEQVCEYVREFRRELTESLSFLTTDDFYSSLIDAVMKENPKSIRGIDECILEISMLERELAEARRLDAERTEELRDFLIRWSNEYLFKRDQRYTEQTGMRYNSYRKAAA